MYYKSVYIRFKGVCKGIFIILSINIHIEKL